MALDSTGHANVSVSTGTSASFGGGGGAVRSARAGGRAADATPMLDKRNAANHANWAEYKLWRSAHVGVSSQSVGSEAMFAFSSGIMRAVAYANEWRNWTPAIRAGVYDYAEAALVESGALPEKFARRISFHNQFLVVTTDEYGERIAGTEAQFSTAEDAEVYQLSRPQRRAWLLGITYDRKSSTIFAGALNPEQHFPQYGVTTTFESPSRAIQNVILHEYNHQLGCGHPCAHVRSHEAMGLPFEIQE